MSEPPCACPARATEGRASQPLYQLVVKQRCAARVSMIAGTPAVARLSAVRNRLAHLHPEDPAQQALDLNPVFETGSALLQLTERISARAALPGEDAPPQPGG